MDINNLLKLHHKYAPSDDVFDLVVVHCRIVQDIALQLIRDNDLKINTELVSIGAFIHDIGVHSLFQANGKLKDNANYITHGILGEKILRSEGFPEEICRFASNHTGVGLTKKDIKLQNLPLPNQDYVAHTDEELLVMYADKFHSKTSPPYFNSYEWFKNDIKKFGEDKSILFQEMADKFGKPDLEFLKNKYGFDIR